MDARSKAAVLEITEPPQPQTPVEGPSARGVRFTSNIAGPIFLIADLLCIVLSVPVAILGYNLLRGVRLIPSVNLFAFFAAAGTSLQRAVKAHVFHTDLRNFDAFDEAWREFFPARPPCRATVGIGGLPVPGCVVAIDLIAAHPDAPIQVFSSSAPRASSSPPSWR